MKYNMLQLFREFAALQGHMEEIAIHRPTHRQGIAVEKDQYAILWQSIKKRSDSIEAILEGFISKHLDMKEVIDI